MANTVLSLVFQFLISDYGISSVELCQIEDYFHSFVSF